jgi:putative flippase GtrA
MPSRNALEFAMKKRCKILFHTAMANQFIRYSLVGGCSVLVYYALLIWCVEVLRLNPSLAAGLAFGSNVILAYPFNYYWTFRSRSGHGYALPRFVATSVLGLFVNISIVFFFTNLLGWWYVWGATIGVIVGPILNFFLNARWSFSAVDRKDRPFSLPATMKGPVMLDQLGNQDRMD